MLGESNTSTETSITFFNLKRIALYFHFMRNANEERDMYYGKSYNAYIRYLHVEKIKAGRKLPAFCCPTWTRTTTNSTKNCRTTIILSGNTCIAVNSAAFIGMQK